MSSRPASRGPGLGSYRGAFRKSPRRTYRNPFRNVVDVPAIPPGDVEPPEPSPEIEERGTDVPLALNWIAMADVLSLRPDLQGSEQREQLFKELVARGEVENGSLVSKQRQLQLKGVLSQTILARELLTMLRKRGAAISGFGKLAVCIGLAFEAARRGEDPITAVGMSHIDMNQFHSLVLHLGHYLDLRWYFASVVSDPELADPVLMLEDYPVQPEDFTRTLRLLTCAGASHLPSTSWSHIRAFEGWAAEPKQAFETLLAEAELRRGIGTLSFKELADECLYHVHEALPASLLAHSAGFGFDSRTRAYRLLQVLNNTPSLPNAVPGPFPPSPRRRTTPRSTGTLAALEMDGEDHWQRSRPSEAQQVSPLTPRRRGDSGLGPRGPSVNIYAGPWASPVHAPLALGAAPIRAAGLAQTPRQLAVAPMA